uniref:ATP synthase subunit a n=1 Tax=Beraeodes minutus TaxID=425955 RepID=A0A7D7AFK5_9NEOP|nr:ATP synthase F0 subunit 6 [Beraeodes minutus]
MMNNLFSIFDPSSSFNLSMNWLSTFLGLMIIPPIFWMIPNRILILWIQIMKFLHSEFKMLMGPTSWNGSTLIFISLFSLILFNNFLGLFPYIFNSTSHLTMTLTLALPLWLSFMIYGWINHTTQMLAHLIPTGTPPLLMSFMVMIETISNIIRPLTLSIRLMANMIAGHLLITLLSKNGNTMMTILLSILIITEIALLTLESAVAVIQAYVFSILSMLYSNEVNH